MPQRRAVAGKADTDEKKSTVTTSENNNNNNNNNKNNNSTAKALKVLEVTQGSLSLEEAQLELEPLSTLVDDDDRHERRVKLWKESPFAVGLTEPTWMEERYRSSRVPTDESGCLCCSAFLCPLLGAGRVGNMAVLKSSVETVEISVEDEETGQTSIRRVNRPKLDIIAGPYWPMLCLVTYPIIFGVSGWAFYSGIYKQNLPLPVIFVWTICTSGLIISLACTAFRDPGILRRVRNLPAQHANSWRWTDQADSYRPRNSWYDVDTAVVVEGFDHTCPWTGTAIGKRNMLSFQFFVCLVFVCMIMDIFILTGAVAH